MNKAIINEKEYVLIPIEEYEKEEELEETKLLSEVAKVGDYVDYPVEYENQKDSWDGLSKLKGWRVLENDGLNVTLVSAGISETYYHKYGESKESLLKLHEIANKYLDLDYGESARALDKKDLDDYLGYDSWELNETYDDLIKVDECYWLATGYSTKRLYIVNSNGNISISYCNHSFGVRPVVVLKSNIKTTKKKGDCWILENN